MNFEELYKNLNTAQKKAVDTIEGPVMVIAGPGTGKTSILTLRIANILKKTDTRPEQILALTFTESGVQSMRAKLSQIIGGQAYKVNIYTFHGFANTLIKTYPDAFPRIVASNNASEIDKVSIIEHIIDTETFEILRPYGEPYYYVTSIINALKHLKRENISVDSFKDIVQKQADAFKVIPDLYYESGAHKGKMKGKYITEEKKLKKNLELVRVYDLYEQALQDKKLYDFEDMLLEVIKAMKNDSEFLLLLQEEYQYFLADEHQDANNAQNTILELLANFHQNPNLFVVGDEKQAIFRFQGASLENFLYFKNLYPEVVLINLENNYRSTQSILDASHSLIEHNQTDPNLRVKLKAHNQKEAHLIQVRELSSEFVEKAYIAHEIKKLINQGVNAGDIAILFRQNKEAENIARALSSEGISYRIYSDKNILEDYEVRKLIRILETINDPSQDAFLGEISFFDIFDLPLVPLYDSFKEARYSRNSLFSLFGQHEELKSFIDLILNFSSQAKNTDLITFFEYFLSQTKYASHLLKKKSAVESMNAFESFLEEIKIYALNHRGANLEDFLTHVHKMDEYHIKIKGGEIKKELDKVAIMTAHKSKGLEYDYVFISGVTDSLWGNTRDRKVFDLPLVSSSHIDDERRLFFVALTRAKKNVYISYANASDDKKTNLPSQFILEIDPTLVAREDVSDFETQMSNTSQVASFSRHEQSLFDKEYLRNIFLTQDFSVTALNNFLSCPLKYFFNNLIRVPSLPGKHQSYGTAMHDTLKVFFSSLKEKRLTTEEVCEIFEKELALKPMNSIDYKESLERGKESLKGYFNQYGYHFETHVLCEYSVRGVTISIPDTDKEIILRGIIDKIELTKPDRNEPQIVHVVDYKTSKPKSRNEIEGKTAHSEGAYKKQLIFYKILLNGSSDSERIYEMKTGEIDFIEPNDKGVYKKEVFEIQEEEVEDLILTLKNTLKEIYDFDFWDKGCNEKDCDACKLYQTIKS